MAAETMGGFEPVASLEGFERLSWLEAGSFTTEATGIGATGAGLATTETTAGAEVGTAEWPEMSPGALVT